MEAGSAVPEAPDLMRSSFYRLTEPKTRLSMSNTATPQAPLPALPDPTGPLDAGAPGDLHPQVVFSSLSTLSV